jgi:hypothetical protein
MAMSLTLASHAPSAAHARRLSLLGRLQDAEDDHDRAVRSNVAGVTSQLLDADKTRWSRVGSAIAALACQVRDSCAVSAFAEARPQMMDITARLSEAIDDQLDPCAWRIVDAAARLAADGQ